MDWVAAKYLKAFDGQKVEFNIPATDEQIAELEGQFGIELPNDYKDFLRLTNGLEGNVNEFVVSFVPVEEIYIKTKTNCLEYFPWAIFIGTNKNLEMFVIDLRNKPYMFGLLPYIGDDGDFIALGDTFEKFVMQLYNDTAFKKD